MLVPGCQVREISQILLEKKRRQRSWLCNHTFYCVLQMSVNLLTVLQYISILYDIIISVYYFLFYLLLLFLEHSKWTTKNSPVISAHTAVGLIRFSVRKGMIAGGPLSLWQRNGPQALCREVLEPPRDWPVWEKESFIGLSLRVKQSVGMLEKLQSCCE